MNPIITTYALTASSATAVCASQAVSGAGNLTINGGSASGGVATLDTARRLSAVSANAGDTTQTLTYTGTSQSGSVISETITLNGTVAVGSVLDYKTVKTVRASASTAGNITVGTNAIGSTQWFLPTRELSPFELQIAISVPVSTTATVEYTYDDPNVIDNTRGFPSGTVAPNSVYPPTIWTDSVLKNITNTQEENSYDFPIYAFRLTINSGTGTARMWANQAGING